MSRSTTDLFSEILNSRKQRPPTTRSHEFCRRRESDLPKPRGWSHRENQPTRSFGTTGVILPAEDCFEQHDGHDPNIEYRRCWPSKVDQERSRQQSVRALANVTSDFCH